MPHDRDTTATGITAAILLAAGSSARMAGIDKLWYEVEGRPLIAYALRTLAELDDVHVVVAVAPRDRHEALRALVADLDGVDLRCVEGGARRQDSVAAGLAAVPEADWVLVHDAARPLVTREVCAAALRAARLHGAAIPAVPLVDTVKRVDVNGRVEETVDRAALRAVQTPQAFAAPLLRRAHAEVAWDVTDDAAQVEALGAPVHAVPGDPRTFKVTTPEDLQMVRTLIAIWTPPG
ncbi:MAG: 2-C-methyl-D-erythritol 4-phosphate cytidylyltransferase [Dehalococcoidia bacterium]